MKYTLLLFAACLTLGSFSETVAATTLEPVLSGTVTDENGDGTPEAVGLGFGHPDAPNYGTTLTQKSNYERLSVEEFDLTGFTAFESAFLTFTLSNSLSPATSIATYVGAGDGLITLADFSSASTALGTRAAPGNQGVFITYDVTAELNALLAGGATYASFRQQIASATGSTAVYTPQLTVTAAAVPEPSRALLCVAGISLLLLTRRRSRRG